MPPAVPSLPALNFNGREMPSLQLFGSFGIVIVRACVVTARYLCNRPELSDRNFWARWKASPRQMLAITGAVYIPIEWKRVTDTWLVKKEGGEKTPQNLCFALRVTLNTMRWIALS